MTRGQRRSERGMTPAQMARKREAVWAVLLWH